MQVLLRLDGRVASGGSSLVMHSERLVDPLDTFTQAIAEVSKKRGKTLADHERISYLEFLGGMYCDPPLEFPVNGSNGRPVIPAWNVLRCLQDGAKRNKRGMDVPRGIFPLEEFAVIEYDGPTDPQKMWETGGFVLRKAVGIQRSRTMRTRPVFTDWQSSLRIEVDQSIFDLHTLQALWKDAGVYAGLGEMRPVYGRFAATAEEVKA